MKTAFVVVLKLLKVIHGELSSHFSLILQVLSDGHPLLGLLRHDGELEPLVVLEQGQHARRHLCVWRLHPGESWVAHLVRDLGVAAPVTDHCSVLACSHHRLDVAVWALGADKGSNIVADVVDKDCVAAPDITLSETIN